MIDWIVSSSALIVVVLGVRSLCAGGLSCRARYALWLLVLARLLAPVQMFTASWGMSAPELPEAVVAHRNDAGFQLVPEAPNPSLPPERQAAQWRENWADYEAALRQGGAEHGTPVTLPEVLNAVWFGGAGILAVVLLASNLCFVRRLRKTRIPYDKGVYVAEGLASPCLIGVFRPTVYLTPEAARDARTLRHVLAHEATHKRHGDSLWSLLRLVALCLHWYNPLVWVAAVVSKRDGELACDEATLERLGADERLAYGETLLSMVRAKPNARELLSVSTAMTAGKHPMRERIETIARHPRTRGAVLALALAVLLGATVLAFSKGEKTGSGTTPQTPVTEPEREGEIPRQIDLWEADLDGDGRAERLVLDTEALLAGGEARFWIETDKDARIDAGSVGTPHTGWATVALTERDGKTYLLSYSPAMFQGEAEYAYRLMRLNGGELSTAEVQRVKFSANPDKHTENSTDAMRYFQEKANDVWAHSRLLFTTDQEVLSHIYEAETGVGITAKDAFYIAEGDETLRYTETMYGLLNADAEALFAAIAGNYWFLSGAGGWHSELNVKSDGTFTGFYRDFDVETVYYSDFAGRFDSVVKVNDFTYSMRLRELSAAPNEGEEHVETTGRWIGALPYGIENTDEVLVFMHGAPVDKLPEEFVRWYTAGLAYGRAQIGDELPTVGLYCVDQGYGWFAWELIAPLVHEQQPEPEPTPEPAPVPEPAPDGSMVVAIDLSQNEGGEEP